MTSDRQLQRKGHRTTWIRLALACTALVAVLAARSVAPRFAPALGDHSSISADSHHDQRPRFVDSGAKWIAPAEIHLLFPTSADFVLLAPAPRLYSTLHSTGFRYNRPPPIG
ncbi:MAG: hypothetical protein WAK62_11195 [Terriglobales bacterium]